MLTIPEMHPYDKIEGELLKLGFEASPTTVRNVLKRHGITPAPVRSGSIGWRHLMTHYKEQRGSSAACSERVC